MVYASTKATLKTEFGSAYITEELHATTLEETTLEGYKKHKREFAAPAPLTTREEEIQELRKTEVRTEISTDTRHQTLGGLSCPLSDATLAAVQDLLRGNYDYLQFRIALEEERIHVSHAAKVQLADLPKQVPDDHARYHLYLFKHTHEGDYMESFVFIYSMPGYACSVRERMMYSSCKAPFLEQLAALGVDIIKKVSEAPQYNRVPLFNLYLLFSWKSKVAPNSPRNTCRTSCILRRYYIGQHLPSQRAHRTAEPNAWRVPPTKAKSEPITTHRWIESTTIFVYIFLIS